MEVTQIRFRLPRCGVRLVISLAQLSLAGRLAAQRVPPPDLLFQPGSVRNAGLHGAGAALVGDAGAVFSNPAGLATIRHIGVEGTYRRTRFNAIAASAALGWRLQQFDVGGGLAYVGGDSLPSVGLARGPQGRPYQAMAVGSLVYRFGLFALGGSIKEVRRLAGGVEERGRSGDLGVAIAVFDIMAIGFAMQDVGGNWYPKSAMALPRLTRWGFTMNYADPQETFRLMSTVEAQWPANAPSRWILGAEAGVVLYGVGVLGRAAYQTRTTGTTEPALTLGGSVALARLEIDYAYSTRDLVGAGTPAHRVGLRLTL